MGGEDWERAQTDLDPESRLGLLEKVYGTWVRVLLAMAGDFTVRRWSYMLGAPEDEIRLACRALGVTPKPDNC